MRVLVFEDDRRVASFLTERPQMRRATPSMS
jgi:hypothetical protein